MRVRKIVVAAFAGGAIFACANSDLGVGSSSTEGCRPPPCPPATELDVAACTCRPVDAGADANDAGVDTCSTGPAYDASTVFPVDDDPGGHPNCIPRCGAISKDGFYEIDALPSGTCAVEGEQCSIGIHFTCAKPLAFGRVDDMRCDCESGNWHCVIAAQGSGSCPPFDAGANDD